MSMSETEIASIARILDDALRGGLVRKVISPSAPGRLVLEIRTVGVNHLLQLVISPFFSRLGRVEKSPIRAATPHPFVMLLRREAEGMRIRRIEQLGDDRVVSIALEGPGGTTALVTELTSRHSNMFWIGTSGKIEGSFHPNRSSRRTLVPGESYTPPEPRTQAIEPSSRFDHAPDPEMEMELHYRLEEERAELEAERGRVGRALSIGLKRLDKLVTNLEKDRRRAREADVLQSQAYLLQANLHNARRGLDTLDVTDFEGNPAVIKLDPALDPVANMAHFFKRAKRLKRATGRIDARMDDTLADLEALKDLEDRLASADREGLEAIREALRERFPDLARRAQPGKEKSEGRSPFHEFAISAGRVARVGRSAADNDTLTLKHARPGDLWLHVRGRKGSHVVVPMGRGEDPTSEILIDAAHLAVRFSDARDVGDVEVTYTRRKYVQKPRGAPPGSVRLLQEKTLFLKVDPERLARIMGRE